MIFPPICYTDASFSGGNHTPSQWAEYAAKTGHDTIMIHDRNSMSAILRFNRACKKYNLKMLIGVELDLYIPQWSALICQKKHGELLRKYTQFSGSDTVDKMLAVANELSNQSASKKNKEFEALIADLTSNVIRVSLVARDNESYKSLLRLSSIRSIRKRNAMGIVDDELVDEDAQADELEGSEEETPDEDAETSTVPDSGPLSVQDLLEWGTGVDVLLHHDIVETSGLFELDINILTSLLGDKLKGIALSPFENIEMLRQSNALGFSLIPWHPCRYAAKQDYDDFCVKNAIHQKTSIYHRSFVAPPASDRMHPKADFSERFVQTKQSGIVWIDDFWSDYQGIALDIGGVKLPNFAMPYKEVVKFALEKDPEPEFLLPNFENDSDALAVFDLWLEKKGFSKTEGAWSELRQRKLNDYYLFKLSYDGLLKRLEQEGWESNEEMQTIYKDRHKMEFDVIARMGFSGYFLIEYDFIAYARKIGVPVGPGRGSAAGSLLVYALEITDVDPIKYDLQFERFLNPERVSMPDIDVDLGVGDGVSRNNILRYISQKYQQPGTIWPSSSQIANIIAYRAKTAIKRVRSALGLSMYYDAYVSRLVSQYCVVRGLKVNDPIDWDDFLQYEPIQARMHQEPNLKRLFRHARALTGKQASYGVHAGGVVISPTTVPEFSAVECDSRGNFFCQFDKDDIESAGLVKFDILGLKTLNVVDEIIRQIKADLEINLNPRLFPTDDPKVMALINDLVLCDIFQLESSGMRKLVADLQPKDVAEIAVLSALYRPGALDSKMPDDFVAVKFGRKAPHYDHPALKTVTESTYGCIVYQEQVMSIVRELAGYSLGEADLLRRAMGKKKIEEMKKQKSRYNGMAQAFWRQHQIDVGNAQGSTIPWDLCLNDLKAELDAVGLLSVLSNEGYLSDVMDVVPALSVMLDLDEAQTESLKSRVDHFAYTVREFKSHYQSLIDSVIRHRLKSLEGAKIEEAALRIYYALTQMVRFNQVFNKVEKFAGYGFNKSHALAYSVVTYQAAWLKTFYPAHFYAGTLTWKSLKVIEHTISEMTHVMGIKLLPPDLNHSECKFKVEGNAVRYGLKTIKSINSSANVIVKSRKDNGYFTGFFEAVQRLASCKVMKSAQLVLVKSGAFDVFIPSKWCSRNQLDPRAYASHLLNVFFENKSLLKEPILSNWTELAIHQFNDHDTLVYSSVLYKKTSSKDSVWQSLLNGSLKETIRGAIHLFMSMVDRTTPLCSELQSAPGLNGFFEWVASGSLFLGGVTDDGEMFQASADEIGHFASIIDNEITSWIYSGTSALMESLFGGSTINGALKDATRTGPELRAIDSQWISWSEGIVRLRKGFVAFSACLNMHEQWGTLLQKTKDSCESDHSMLTLFRNELTYQDVISATTHKGVTERILMLLLRSIDSGSMKASGLLSFIAQKVSRGNQSISEFSAFDRRLLDVLMYWKLSQTLNVFPAIFSDFQDFHSSWVDFSLFLLRRSASRPSIAAIEDEYTVVGCYLGQTPAQAIGLAQLAEQEPAGTFLDGVPVPIANIDPGLSGRRISTYGTIQKVQKTKIKKENSRYFNESRMFFDVVYDSSTLRCQLIGTKVVSSVESDVFDGALVMVAGSLEYSEQYGLQMTLEAIKRFHPDPMIAIKVLPKLRNR